MLMPKKVKHRRVMKGRMRGKATRGENLEGIVGGQARIYMPQGVAERGDDYEIVKFKEMVREA